MPLNKIGQIAKDATDYPYWNARHVERASIVLNTMSSEDTLALVLSDKVFDRLMEVDSTAPDPDLPEMMIGRPFFIQFDPRHVSGDTPVKTICVLAVYNADTKELECYPYGTDTQGSGKIWPYDMRFTIRNPELANPVVHRDSFHPAALLEQMDTVAVEHMQSLSRVVLSTIKGISQGIISIDDSADAIAAGKKEINKINAKRLKSGKTPLRPDVKINLG